MFRVVLSGLIACMIAASASAEPPPKIAIAISSASLPGGVARIAREMGLFEQHGIDARTPVMENSSVSSSALIGGSVDFTTSAGSEAVVAQARGQDEVAIARLYSGFSGVLVLAKPVADRLGVAATAPVPQRLKALDGLLIATPNPTSSYTLALRPAADAHGAKVRFTYVSMAGMVAALESGAVQGFVASSPFYALPVIRGTGVIWINGPQGEFPSDFTPGSVENLHTMRSFATSHPALIRAVLAVFVDFVTAVRERPAAVKQAIGRLFPELDAKTLDLLFAIESPAFVAEPPTPELMRRDIAFVKASGVNLPALDRLDPAALMFP